MGRKRKGGVIDLGIEYDPLPSQAKFHDSEARFKGFSGPIRSGKSQALCHEAIRLAALLLEHRLGATPATYALSALMHLNAARLPARVDAAGDLQSLFDQDRSLWDRKLVLEGLKLLEFSASGSELNSSRE